MTGEAIIICRVDNFRFGNGRLPWFLLAFVAAVKVVILISENRC
jgi:hypothetical protein